MITPPGTSLVCRSTPASFIAYAFARIICRSVRETATGLSGVTASINWCVGSDTGDHRCSSHSPLKIHLPFGIVLAYAAIRSRNSAWLLQSVRCTPTRFAPPTWICTCASLNPGSTSRPCSWMIVAPGTASFSIAALLPVARICVPSIATAWVTGSLSTPVHTLPPTSTTFAPPTAAFCAPAPVPATQAATIIHLSA